MELKYKLLNQYFGHSEFRSGQEKVIDSVMAEKDVLAIMPTGAGKSICYQIPALAFDGITIVISPLISLMKDQVSSLINMGIPAAYLNSSLSNAQMKKAMCNAQNGMYKIIYVAPERLENEEFIDFCNFQKIPFVAIDESHCVSQWGPDFRPSYLKIADFISKLKVRPVVGAFTATATKDVKNDILKLLNLKDPTIIKTNFDRPNLFFSVLRPEDKDRLLIELLNERKDKSGIIYCSTRKSVEDVCDLICENGFRATKYHAGLSNEERKLNQDDFEYDKKTIMVATNAFGMGIDKSNVSFVIHYNMPKDLESYYQEAGRAGRDGEKADCILLYKPNDKRIIEFLIDRSQKSNNENLTVEQQIQLREKELQRLKQMVFYCTTDQCLRTFILRYFDEKSADYCGNCSNCLSNFENVDVTLETNIILNCIINTGQRFGKSTIVDVLKGAKNERITNSKLDKEISYGKLNKTTKKDLYCILNYLEIKRIICITDGQYPIIKVTNLGYDFINNNENLNMKLLKDEYRKNVHYNKKNQVEDEFNLNLFNELKELRNHIAHTIGVPAFVVFSNASLVDMCKKMPKNTSDMMKVSGVGYFKMNKYGKEFLDVIDKYQK